MINYDAKGLCVPAPPLAKIRYRAGRKAAPDNVICTSQFMLQPSQRLVPWHRELSNFSAFSKTRRDGECLNVPFYIGPSVVQKILVGAPQNLEVRSIAQQHRFRGLRVKVHGAKVPCRAKSPCHAASLSCKST
jgi:hypothetical protein